MLNRIAVSIVIPLRGGISPNWLNHLTSIKGEAELICIYPPDTAIDVVDDIRVKTLKSPIRGEVTQRLIGLFNATGEYVLCIDDDQYVHPDIVSLVTTYFQAYPESWVLRLQKEDVSDRQVQDSAVSWEGLPVISNMPVLKRGGDISLYEQGNAMLALPIAPLKKRFDIRNLWPFFKNKDCCGWHVENFYQKIWRNDLVQPAIQDLTKTMRIVGPLKWIPFWTLDRLMGLFIQAKFFEDNKIVGHWLPKPPQIITIDPGTTRSRRFYFLSDILLVKRYPQYGYFWNLAFSHIWGIVKRAFKFTFKKRK